MILPLLTAGFAAPAQAAQPEMACSSMVFNGCFWPQTGFNGPEYKTTIYFKGCWKIPASRSYSISAARPVTLYAAGDCTGQSHRMPGWGFNPDIGFSVQSYYYEGTPALRS